MGWSNGAVIRREIYRIDDLEVCHQNIASRFRLMTTNLELIERERGGGGGEGGEREGERGRERERVERERGEGEERGG